MNTTLFIGNNRFSDILYPYLLDTMITTLSIGNNRFCYNIEKLKIKSFSLFIFSSNEKKIILDMKHSPIHLFFSYVHNLLSR